MREQYLFVERLCKSQKAVKASSISPTRLFRAVKVESSTSTKGQRWGVKKSRKFWGSHHIRFDCSWRQSCCNVNSLRTEHEREYQYDYVLSCTASTYHTNETTTITILANLWLAAIVFSVIAVCSL
eukprot:scaffold1900_cov123-Cylindrotheca_fusiformis.AAC.24